MKEINNWEVIIKDENGNEDIGILLPGCIIRGEIEEGKIEIEVIDVDTSNLIVTDIYKQKYLLSSINREYLGVLSKCMEIGKNERNGEDR